MGVVRHRLRDGRPAGLLRDDLEPGGGQPLYDRLWGSAFLPSRYQGVKFRSGGDPVLFLSNPDGFSTGNRRTFLDRSAS